MRGRYQGNRSDGDRSGRAAGGPAGARRRCRHHDQGSTITTTSRQRERALRDGDVDVVVVDGMPARMAEAHGRTAQGNRHRRHPDSSLCDDRAAAAGISADELLAICSNPRRSPTSSSAKWRAAADDETAAFIMTLVLFGAISHRWRHGAQRRRRGEIEPDRRGPPRPHATRNLLAGKIAGIGLLGLAQVAATAVVASSPAHWSTRRPSRRARQRDRLGGRVVPARIRPLRNGVRKPRFARRRHRGRGPASPGQSRSSSCSRSWCPSPPSAASTRRGRGSVFVVPTHRAARHAQPPDRDGRRHLVGTGVAAALTTRGHRGPRRPRGPRYYGRAILHTGATLSLGDAWRIYRADRRHSERWTASRRRSRHPSRSNQGSARLSYPCRGDHPRRRARAPPCSC